MQESWQKAEAYLGMTYDDVWMVGGARTAFADFGGTLAGISPTDLGIAAARAALERSEISADEIGVALAASLGPGDFDAIYLPRHIALYSGVPQEIPALALHRLCGSGFELISQAADTVWLGKADVALCVGTESMSRFPIAAFDHRNGFALGRVDFRDYLWESLTDTAPDLAMGRSAERLALRYGITRADADDFAAQSFARALRAREAGFFADEIVALTAQSFELDGYRTRTLRLPRGVEAFDVDEHARPTTLAMLEGLRPSFDGVQTAGNSSAIVDGAAAVTVCSGDYLRGVELEPLARIVGATAVGVPPELMGIGPVPAIRGLLELAELPIEAIDRFEINEAFAAQYLAVERELELDRDRVNVNGGAIAIGHPLAATGLRCLLTLARELRASGGRYGIGSACCGGGQGVAVLLENPDAA